MMRWKKLGEKKKCFFLVLSNHRLIPKLVKERSNKGILFFFFAFFIIPFFSLNYIIIIRISARLLCAVSQCVKDSLQILKTALSFAESHKDIERESGNRGMCRLNFLKLIYNRFEVTRKSLDSNLIIQIVFFF